MYTETLGAINMDSQNFLLSSAVVTRVEPAVGRRPDRASREPRHHSGAEDCTAADAPQRRAREGSSIRSSTFNSQISGRICRDRTRRFSRPRRPAPPPTWPPARL